MRVISVTGTVTSSKQEAVTRAAEVFSRAATGLALEGVEVRLCFGPDEDEDDGTDDD